jgi:hypothetical protein
MGTITPSVAPGSYFDPQTISFTFSGDITQVAVTKNAAAPSISKYIAYDTLAPANPFIAVTEDGRGRVVYDGGFPKFYNGANPAQASFAGLTPACKYLYNALNWVANPSKVAAGNKKVLIMGDVISPANYAVKANNAASSSGFYDTMTNVCALAGFTPTFLAPDDYGGGLLNPNLAYYEQFACVLMLSSNWQPTPGITAQAVNDIVTYRENGNGIIIITDHGYNLTSIADVATTDPAFFKTANAIASKFGAYLTGNVDRVPVNVGFIRSHYGDHPLYAGMADSDNIAAGGSESIVVVTPTTLYAPASVPSQSVSTAGLNTLNVLATLSDGSVITGRYVYNIQGAEFVFSTSRNPTTNQDEQNSGKAYASFLGKANMSMNLDGSTLGTVWGEILLNGKRIGEQYYSGGVAYTYWYAGAAGNTPMKNGDVITQAIGVPFSYNKASTVVRPELTFRAGKVSLAQLMAEARTLFGLSPGGNVAVRIFNSLSATLPPGLMPQKLSLAMNVAFLQSLRDGKLQTVEGLTGKLYKTSALTATAVAGVAANPGTVIIDAQTSKVYAYKSGTIQEIVGLKPHDFYGSPRKVQSTVDSAYYQLNTDGTITAL